MDKNQIKETIARRIARELQDGNLVNLGIGLPTLVANYIPSNISIIFHSENGCLGMGPLPAPDQIDPDMINAGGGFITVQPFASFFDSAYSFGIIRGKHLDVTVLGGLQVDEEGNLANWMVPGKIVPGMGGAMDLVTGSKRVIVGMEHCDKNGNSKILKKCTLPLTGVHCVDTIVTEMAVIKVTENNLILMEHHRDYSVDEIIQKTACSLTIDADIKTFE